jgi:hypothetical protein
MAAGALAYLDLPSGTPPAGTTSAGVPTLPEVAAHLEGSLACLMQTREDEGGEEVEVDIADHKKALAHMQG